MTQWRLVTVVSLTGLHSFRSMQIVGVHGVRIENIIGQVSGMRHRVVK